MYFVGLGFMLLNVIQLEYRFNLICCCFRYYACKMLHVYVFCRAFRIQHVEKRNKKSS